MLSPATLDLLVDVDKMQILLAIAKVGQGFRVFVQRDIRIMALEARSIVVDRKRHIELFGEILPENPVILTAVRIVTGIAVALINGPVPVFLLTDVLTEFRVATKAKLFLGAWKQPGVVGGVRQVTFPAFTRRNRLMRNLGVRILGDIGMAAIA
jgi:hypothetical protein